MKSLNRVIILNTKKKLDLNKNKKKVFIIGATGYIGSNFAQRLSHLGCYVIGSTRDDTGIAKLKLSGSGINEVVRGSFEDLDNLIVAAKSADVIIYTAYAYNNNPSNNGKQIADQELKNKSSHITKILEAIKGSGKTFILISGGGVLGDSKDVVYEEETELQKIDDNDEDASIINARRALEDEVRYYEGIRGIVLRPPIVYGRKGSLMIPKYLLDSAVNNNFSMYIENSENNKWSTVHIDDLTELLISAIECAPAGSLYNTASETGITTLQIAESISRVVSLVFGVECKTKAVSVKTARNFIYEGEKTFGRWADWWNINSQCSGEKAKKELNWEPKGPSILEDIEYGSYKKYLEERYKNNLTEYSLLLSNQNTNVFT